MPKVFRFFLYIFANEISIKLFSTKKTKRNNDENKHNFAKVIINSYRFCGIVELKE